MPVFDIFKRLVNQNTDPDERRADERVRATLGARVLVVDDSATIRAVLGKMLAQDGYEVLKAADGESAVEMAQSQLPDLIFLDIVLPGMSGFAVLRALRRDSRTRTTPIVMMSGNQQATEQFYVQRFGADGFIKKPFGRAEAFHSIRSLVQARRMFERVETPVAAPIPEDMSAEEWNAIPDVAMPDDANFVAQQAEPRNSDPLVDEVPDGEVAATGSPLEVEPEHPPGAANSEHGISDPDNQAGAKPATVHSWSVPTPGMTMWPTLGSGLRAIMTAAASVVVHVRWSQSDKPSAPASAEKPENIERAPDEDKA